ncbi:MAG: hypothetical protein R3Y11_10345 [Pseudomonadota bacterium]
MLPKLSPLPIKERTSMVFLEKGLLVDFAGLSLVAFKPILGKDFVTRIDAESPVPF